MMDNQENKLLRKPSPMRKHLAETMQLAVPVILGQVGHMLIGSADTVMIGGLGSRYLAASSIANALFFLIAVIGIGVTVVIAPLTAQAIGARDSKDALSSRLHQGLIVSFWIGTISMCVLFGVAELIPYLQQQPETVPLAQSYLRIVAISLPFIMLFTALKNFLDGFEAVVPGMAMMGFMVLFHIFFNWLMIHGKWGFPRMELDGAGWSTVISRILGLAAMAAIVIYSKRFGVYFKWRLLVRHRWGEIKEILKIGIPSGMQYFFEVGAFAGALLLAGRISKEAQSAHQIAIQIASLTYMFYMGISSAVSIRIGNALGRQDAASIRIASRAALTLGLGCVVIFVGTILGLRHQLPWLFIQEEPVVLIAAKLLLIAAVFQLFDGIQAIVMGALRGISDVVLPTGITFVAYWVIGLPGAWYFSEQMGWGVEGIWLGLTTGLCGSAFLLVGRLIAQTRAHKLPPQGDAGT
jgi:MATE family multidrug resistance protein